MLCRIHGIMIKMIRLGIILMGVARWLGEIKNKPLWVWLDSGCYAFNEHGVMYCDCVTAEGWYVDRSGDWVK